MIVETCSFATPSFTLNKVPGGFIAKDRVICFMVAGLLEAKILLDL